MAPENKELEMVYEGLRDLRQEVKDEFRAVHTRLDRVNERLSALESWRGYIMGMAAAIAAGVSMAWQWVMRRQS